MKGIINKIWMLLVVSLIAGACQEDELTVLNPNATTVVSLSATDIVLEESNVGQDALTVNWTEPDFGFSAAAQYKLLIDLEGGDFSTAQTITTGSQLSKTFETAELNKILVGLGAEPKEAGNFIVKVMAVLSKTVSIDSDVMSFTATPYADKLDLSSPWGVVGSAYNDWGGAGPDAPFYKVQGQPGVYVAYVTLKDGEFKIRKDNDWTVNYGDDGLDGTLEPGGANIPVTAGTYKITFNENDLTYTIELYSWGIVGSAYNDWGGAGPDAQLQYDPFTDTWRIQVKLLTGEFKFRLNNDWGVNYGDDGGDGTLEPGGANIVVDEGYYEIIVNFNDFTYTMQETQIFGVVGSGYNDWGNAGPDFPFQKDFGNEGMYYIDEITLLDGEIKFRVNNDWTVNYGDDGLDGTLEEGGANIPTTAGVYRIELDFTNPSSPTYSITQK